MNQKKSKQLRRMARQEMSSDHEIQERELMVARVRGNDRVINNPNTNRAMYLSLKSAYKQVTRK